MRTVEPLLIKYARSPGFSTLPVFTGVRLAGANSILVLVAAEMVGAKQGSGYLINSSRYNFQVSDIYAGITTIARLGVAFKQALTAAEGRLPRWRN